VGTKRAMIRNGLYHITVEMLDGIKGGNQGVMVVRDGTLRGGDSFFYTYGTYTAANGKWKGEVTNQEHTELRGAAGMGRQGRDHWLHRNLYRRHRRNRWHRACGKTKHPLQIPAAAADPRLGDDGFDVPIGRAASALSERQIQSHARIIECQCPFGSDVGKGARGKVIRTSEPGH